MGSFYTLCSITGQTICDGQEMVVQFMLPKRSLKNDVSIGQMFVESFLRVAKKDGLEKAVASFEESTKTWGNESELGQKGLLVSNDGAYVDWVPFGPAIRGYYDDCGHIKTSDDEENKKRIEILEGLLFGIPFESIMGASTDDRWYTYGLEGDDYWALKGIDKDLPEPAMMLLKKMSVTYMHASVYDELSSEDFSPEHGKIAGYEKEWKEEYLDPIRKKLPEVMKKMKSGSKINKLDPMIFDIGIFRNLRRDQSLIYLACMARENCDIEWFMETLNFMYSLSGMCLSLRPSQYGSQHFNWKGWMRINQSLNPKIQETMTEYGYDEDEEETED